MVAKNKPEWNKIKPKKIFEVNDICSNNINRLFQNANFQDSTQSINMKDLKKSIWRNQAFLKELHLIKKMN